jgi:hypothetical protein
MALNVPTGTAPARKAAPTTSTNGTKHTQNPGSSATGGGTASQPKGAGIKARATADALNPPFDSRMRSIGSPLNLTNQIRRGWIQKEEGDERVNFMFNPSQLDLSHNIDPNNVRLDSQTPPDDVADPWYTSSGSTTGVKLLYDRTYELFSAPAGGSLGFANQYGVWADVAAWYKYLGMLDEMPTSWDNSLITKPAQLFTSYLFIGAKMVFYGWVTGLSVTYSHWTQEMVPQRCSVDIGFQILPWTGDVPIPTDGLQTGNPKTDAESTWLADYFGWRGF